VNPGIQVLFQDLVIQGGLAQDNGLDGALAGTTDALGGGILNNGGNLTLDNVVFQNNLSRGGEVAVLSASGHNADGGGCYSIGGTLTLAGATLTNNQAIGGRGGDHDGTIPAGAGGSASGGGLYATGGSLDIAGCTIASNRATGGPGGDGSFSTGLGGSYNGGHGGTGQGGGLYVNGGSLAIATSAIDSNQGNGGAGGAYGRNGYDDGGGLYNAGALTVGNSTLTGNSGQYSAYSYGGGIYNTGTLMVTGSTLSGNSAPAGEGGGIYNTGTLTATSTTLAGNPAFLAGGGIYNTGFSARLTVSNSTLSGNSAYYTGGGIGTYGPTPITFTNVTLTANRATNGGGLYVNPFGTGAPVLHNTLIAGNFRGATGTTLDDVYGSLNSSSDYNLIGDGTSMTGLSSGVNGNQVGSASAPIDPLLGPLQNNGGPTLTRALLAGSPALNGGDPAQLGVADQRGVVRAGGVNIGAYQASASAFVVTLSGAVTAGTPFDVTMQAVDAFGQVAFGYTGTVTFRVTDTDPAAVLPLDYTFTADDQGRHTFNGAFTLITPGDQTLTVADLANGLSIVPITVNP
jgi:hypothetical protein